MKRVLTAAMVVVVLMPFGMSAQDTPSGRSRLFAYEDNDLKWGMSAGWVAKEWTTSANGRTIHEDLWGNPDKMLHGLQVGLHLQHCFFRGLGWRTGLYYEWYISTSSYIKERGFSRFNEHGLYLPLHFIIQMTPFRKVSITPYAGFGFNWAIYGNFKDGPISGPGGKIGAYHGENLGGYFISSLFDAAINSGSRRGYPHEYFDYNNHSPHHWNVQAEVGLLLRMYSVEVSFTYSWGLNRHWLYDDVPSHQNKMAANLGFTITVP